MLMIKCPSMKMELNWSSHNPFQTTIIWCWLQIIIRILMQMRRLDSVHGCCTIIFYSKTVRYSVLETFYLCYCKLHISPSMSDGGPTRPCASVPNVPRFYIRILYGMMYISIYLYSIYVHVTTINVPLIQFDLHPRNWISIRHRQLALSLTCMFIYRHGHKTHFHMQTVWAPVQFRAQINI